MNALLKSKKQNEQQIQLISIIIIVLFAYTGIDKLIGYNHFAFQLQFLLPTKLSPYASLLAYLVPIVELLAAIILCNKQNRYAGLLLSLILFCLFELYIAAFAILDKSLPCNCVGATFNIGWMPQLVINSMLIVLTYYAWELERHND